jgi:hypothetical protein
MGAESNIRKLRPAKGLRMFTTPEGFEGGIRRMVDIYDENGNIVKRADGGVKKRPVSGVAETVVADQAETILDQLLTAQKAWKSSKGKVGANSTAMKQAVETVVSFANNAKGDVADTVTGSLATALMHPDVDPNFRSDLLRRAGNPEPFAALKETTLDATITPLEPELKAAIREDIPDKPINAQTAQPGMAKLSSHFDEVRADGSVRRWQDGGDRKQLNRPAETMMEQTSTPKKAHQLKLLAGDQISELIAAQRKAGYKNLPSVEAAMEALVSSDKRPSAKNMTAAQRKAYAWVDANTKGGALVGSVSLPPVRKSETVASSDSILKTGTGADAAAPAGVDFNPNRRHSAQAGGKIDDVVDKRNRAQVSKVLGLLNDRTDGGTDLDPNPRYLQPINLDTYFPWWRSRFGDVLPDGTVDYPDRALTAEFITHVIQGMYDVQEKDFFKRTVPLIEKSMAFTVERSGMPLENVKPKTKVPSIEERVALGAEEADRRAKVARKEAAGARTTNRIVDQSRRTFQPGSTFKDQLSEYLRLSASEGGGGTGETRNIKALQELQKTLFGDEKPYSIYSDQMFERAPAASSPEADAAKPKKSGMKASERLRQKKAQSGDQASIYTVPGVSPLRNLIA